MMSTARTPLVADASPAAAVADSARWVNPHIGTKPGGPDFGTGGGAGNTFPGAVVPFGMVQWSPDTATHQPGGYFYDDNRIKGFSLTHLSGPGCSTFQDIPFMPVVGDVPTAPAADPARYISTFSHANEKLSPGYYGVTLDNGANVELTTTQHTGSGRFTYPAGKIATLLVNTSGSIMGTDDAQTTIGRDTISGWAVSGRFCGAGHRYRVHFQAKFDRPFASIGTWKDSAVTPGVSAATGGSPAKINATALLAKTAQAAAERGVVGPQPAQALDTIAAGPGTGAFVTFDNLMSQTVNVQVGLSFVSLAGAAANLVAENTGRTFDEVAAAARAEWNKRLSTIKIQGGSDAERTTFYTALYHSLLHPNVISDADGRYLGFDGRVHVAPEGRRQFSNLSGWDIYRSESQLIGLLAPQEASDIARSMADFAEQGGSWDRWSVTNGYTGVMNGDPYHIIVSNMHAFGARDFDAAKALQLMVRGATQPTRGYEERPGLDDYQRLGYVAPGAPGVWGSAATTLEYTSADFAISQLAGRIGDAATHDTFAKRAQYWRNLFNPSSGYLQPRNRDGSFTDPYDPASGNDWVEGNGAQYTWMVPYNGQGLIAAMGGNDKVRQRLDFFFTKLNAGTKEPYAFLGNEPTLQTPYLYDYAGAPYKTQQVVRRAVNELYGPGPDGIAGNDDLGELSSWYVWSAMGMYPMIPGRAELVLASPLFERITIDRPSGQRIEINAPGAAKDTQYVSGLKVNGGGSTRAWLPESFVSTGGTLDYTLSSTPDTAWGANPADVPPSF
ncbi:GH92 family glycosyl hydrolase [Pseudonocardia aurantiaca]|uniref:GH92 family glycosyl hydrolase n=2 Tax=Pseudonocardia aurantiaca TaxID=75290 RepID=A0ABW4FXA4_9PSEU